MGPANRRSQRRCGSILKTGDVVPRHVPHRSQFAVRGDRQVLRPFRDGFTREQRQPAVGAQGGRTAMRS